MTLLNMKELLECGVHFGHRTRKWNPKMARFIYTERKGIHIIDLGQTLSNFERAYNFVREQASLGKDVLFVGTKKQVQGTIEEEAKRCGMHYVSRRWLGGTLTNFQTIRRRIMHMVTLETNFEEGKFERLLLKERVKLEKGLRQLKRNLEGLRDMTELPGVVYVVDPTVEINAVHEANLLDIPVVAICDTNCDPDVIDFPIPGNDDAIKATRLITAKIADAVLEGREGLQAAAGTKTEAAKPPEDEGAEEVTEGERQEDEAGGAGVAEEVAEGETASSEEEAERIQEEPVAEAELDTEVDEDATQAAQVSAEVPTEPVKNGPQEQEVELGSEEGKEDAEEKKEG